MAKTIYDINTDIDNMKELIRVLLTAEVEEKFSPVLSEDFLI